MTATASPNGVGTPTSSSALSPLSPAAAWKATLKQIEPQMSKATFNQWLRGANLVTFREHHYVIGVESDRAVAWLSQRLNDSITSTLAAFVGDPETTVEYIVMDDSSQPSPPSPAPKTLPLQTEPAPQDIPDLIEPSPFLGFDTPESNWTATPDSFFTHLARREDGVVTKLVAQVIFHTWGQFEDKRRQLRVWEWPVTMTVLHEVCGIKSRTSLYTAIWDARERGYIIMRPLTDADEIARYQERYGYRPAFTLRLKQRDDEIDTPITPRPDYGSRSNGVQ